MSFASPHLLHKLPIEDASFYRQAGITLLDWATAVLRRHSVQANILNAAPGLARLLNLVAWHPDHQMEYLDQAQTTGDLVIHVALHQAIHEYFKDDATEFRIAGEALASASDIYLVGLFAQAGLEPSFLSESLESYSFYYETYGSLQELETLLTEWMANPYQSMLQLARYLYQFTRELLLGQNTLARIKPFSSSRYYPLVHHYHLTNWVLMLGKNQRQTPENNQAVESLFSMLGASETAFEALLAGQQTPNLDL